LPRKRGVARYCATRTRLVASGRSANPPHRGSAATKVEKEKENPDGIKEPGTKKLGCLTL